MSDAGSPSAPVPRSRRMQEGLDVANAFIPQSYRLLAAAVALVVVAAGVWGVLGSVPTKAVGSGLIVRENQRIFPVQSRTSGLLGEILVETGALVESGDALAVVTLDEIDDELDLAKARLTQLKVQLSENQERIDIEVASKEADVEQQLELFHQLTDDLKTLRTRVQQVIEGEEDLLKQGYVKRTDVINYTQLSYELLSSITDIQVEIAAAQADLLDFRRVSSALIQSYHLDVEDEQRKINALESKRERDRTVHAPSNGVIEEIRAATGEVIAPAQTLLTMAVGGRGVEVLAFLQPDQGRRANEGMAVHVIPTTVKKEEFGSIRGEVVSVSEEPVSGEQIRALLQNEQLSETFAAGGEPYLSRIRLIEDSATASGFAWWSGDGAPFPVSLGTLARVEIVVREQPPITLIIPALRKLFGL